MKEIIQAVCFGEVLWDNFGEEKKNGRRTFKFVDQIEFIRN